MAISPQSVNQAAQDDLFSSISGGGGNLFNTRPARPPASKAEKVALMTSLALYDTICDRTHVEHVAYFYFSFHTFTLTPFHFQHCILTHVHLHVHHAFYMTFHSFLILHISTCLPCLLHGFYSQFTHGYLEDNTGFLLYI